MQAMETIKLIAGVGSTLKGKLMVCDFNDMSFATIDIAKNADCPSCQGELTTCLPRGKLVWLCGQNTANINPEKPLALSLNEVYETVKQTLQRQSEIKHGSWFSTTRTCRSACSTVDACS